MPRKSAQGRVLNRKGLLSKTEGRDGNLGVSQKNGKVYLSYKINGRWHYTKMSSTIFNADVNILSKGRPSKLGEISLFKDDLVFNSSTGIKSLNQ